MLTARKQKTQKGSTIQSAGSSLLVAVVCAGLLLTGAASVSGLEDGFDAVTSGADRVVRDLQLFYQLQFELDKSTAKAGAAHTQRCAASSAGSTRGS
jgi:hypothetical protein